MTTYDCDENKGRIGRRMRRLSAVITSVAIALICVGVSSIAAAETSTAAADDEEPDQKSWRVERSDKPPIQVRRAAGQVEQTAAATAAAIGGGDSEEASDGTEHGADEAGDDADRARTTSTTKGSELSDAIDLRRLSRVSDELLASGKESSLVLDPYVDDDRWFEAMGALEADDDRKKRCDEALDDVDEVLDERQVADKPAVSYAVARLQRCADRRPDEAKKTLEELAEGDGPVAQMARAQVADDDGGAAIVDYRDRIDDAKQRAAIGEVDAALIDLEALHEELTQGWSRYQVRIAQVSILERAGRLKEAARHMLGIYRDTRTWSIGDHVERRLEGLDRRAGTNLLTLGERIDRMRELIGRGQYLEARKLAIDNAKRAGVTGREIDGWSDYRLGLQAEKKRDRKKAVRYFESADRLVKSDVIRPRLYYGWARALRRLDRDEEAIELYDRLCEEYPVHRLCDDSLFEGARLSQFMNRHESARQKFAQLVGLFPDSDKAAESLWRGAFSAYLMGDYQSAIEPLEHLQERFGDQSDASELSLGLKAQYWIGVAKLKAGQKEEGLDELQRAVSQGPLTWYGRLAAARLEKAGVKPRADIPDSPMSAEQLEDLSTLHVPEDERLASAAEYARLGMYDEAIDRVREQTKAINPPERSEQMLAALYLADSRPDSAHWIMKRHIDESGPGYHNLRDWGVAFPTDYMELAHRFGSEYDVSPFLVQAIMRQESGFRQKVSSPVGARGLMQLMPGTARYTQREYLENPETLTLSQMVEPETNVRLGTMYVRLHTAFASDHVPLALAGYNAGPAPLESWFERYGDRELDAWVESITYREARGYVRKVFTSYVTYAGLYGDGSLPEVSLEMPDELREWGDVPGLDKVEEGDPVSRRY